MEREDFTRAIKTVEELAGVYRQNAEMLRAKAGSYPDNLEQRQLLHSQAESQLAVAEQLAHVRSVLVDAVKRRRFSRKQLRRAGPTPPAVGT